MKDLQDWENFYVIVGAAAGALIGLQFIAMTLIAERRIKAATDANPVFNTPTVAHFSMVLFLSCLISAPWASAETAVHLCGLIGVIGIGYSVFIAWRMGKQSAYKPDMEDRIFHVAMPLVSYGFFAGACLMNDRVGLFTIAAGALTLLFTGIHNSWDSVVFVSLSGLSEQDEDKR